MTMTPSLFILLFIGLLLLSLGLCWLDHRQGWQLVKWLHGGVTSPFPEQNSAVKEKDQRIQQLEQRIQVLESIVTEPAYELNREIDKLRTE